MSSKKELVNNESNPISSEGGKKHVLTASEIIALNQDNNEFSIFYSELDELKQEDDDKKIYNYLLNKYKKEEDEKEFIEYFYNGNYTSNNNDFKSTQFITVGIFEDLYFYPIWMNDKQLEPTVKILKDKYNLYYWHRTKGDGNCFYRAVMVSYLELIISKCLSENNPDFFFRFLKEFFFTKFPDDKKNFHCKTITVLLFIYEEIMNKSGKAFDILYRVINMSDSIEKSLILWFKIKIVLFLKENLEIEIEGIKLIQSIPSLELEEDMTYNRDSVIEYIDKKLLKTNEYVEGYPLYITPFILKCNLDIYCINQDKSVQLEKMKYNEDIVFSQVISYLPYLNKDKSNNISLIFKNPHYESVSTRERVNVIVDYYTNPDIIFVEGIMSNNLYDKYKTDVLFHMNHSDKLTDNKKNIKSLLQKQFTGRDKCKICNIEIVFRLPCGCIMCPKCIHKKLNDYLSINEDDDIDVSVCDCGYKLDESDIKDILDLPY